MVISRSNSKALHVACLALAVTFVAGADEPAVPLQLQADLTVKVLAHAEQPTLASAGLVALDRVDKVAALSHDQGIVSWAGRGNLVEESKRRKLLVLYVAPGLEEEMRAIAHALEGTQLITVAASDS